MAQEKIEQLTKNIALACIKKGFSHEIMGRDLSLSSSAYWKIENGKTKLSVEDLFRISEILETPLTELMGIGNTMVQQTNNDNVIGYQYQLKFENFYQENKEVYEKLLQSKDEQIALLKSMLEKTVETAPPANSN